MTSGSPERSGTGRDEEFTLKGGAALTEGNREGPRRVARQVQMWGVHVASIGFHPFAPDGNSSETACVV